MFDEIDRAYFERRAREEHARADASRDAAIAAVHRRFADEYERKAEAAVPKLRLWTRGAV